MKDSVISEIRNNLGWIYVQLRKYSKAKEEFKKAIHLDPLNVKARHNLRALGKIGLDLEQEISQVQKYLSILLSLSLIVLFFSFLVYNRPSETVFAAQSITLVALLIFILFYHQITKFKAGAIEFEKSTELRSQYIEDISLRDLRALVEAIL